MYGQVIFLKLTIISLVFIFALVFNAAGFDGNISAASAVVMEQSTGKVIYSKNQNSKMKPASTTKILTAITALENCNTDELVKVSENAALTEGSSMYIEKDEILTMENLLYGLMLNSGNDAAVAIAEHISKTTEKFSALMNETAKKAGAKHSNFVNPNGLDDDNHYTTAHDLAVITAYALNNPLFKNIVKTKTKIVETKDGVKKYLTNHNKLLNMYKDCDGVKTGFTKASGRTLVSTAERDGMRLITVTLNAPNDWNDHVKLFNYGFELYTVITPVTEGEVVYKGYVKDGVKTYVEMYAEKTAKYTVKKNDADKYVVNYINNEIHAPVKKGDVVGEAIILFDGEIIEKIHLLSNENIEKLIIPKTFKEIFREFFAVFLHQKY